MHSTFIGFAAGVAWMMASFFIEDWFPIGDWRWAVGTIIALLVAVAVHLHGRRRAMKTTNNSANGFDVAGQVMTAPTLERATDIHSRFMASPRRDGDIHVEAALAIRRNRKSGMVSAFAANVKAAQDEQELIAKYGHERYMRARSSLEDKFPTLDAQGRHLS